MTEIIWAKKAKLFTIWPFTEKVSMSSIGSACVPSHFSRVCLCVALWMVARQAPLSMGFSRQEYWSRLPFSPPGDLPNPEVEAASPALAGRFFTTVPPGKPNITYAISQIYLSIKHFFGSQQNILKNARSQAPGSSFVHQVQVFH